MGSLAINLTKTTNSGFIDRTETITQYFDEIRQFKELSDEEEKALFIKYNDPSTSSIEKDKIKSTILSANLRFVVSAARQHSTNLNFSDIIQQGNLGMLEAFDKFEVDKGAKFITYASQYIRRSITQYIRDVEPTVYQPNSSKTFHVVSRIRNKFVQMNEREPSEEELMQLINEEDAKAKFQKLYEHTPSKSEFAEYLANEYHPIIKEKTDLLSMNVMSIDTALSDDSDSENLKDSKEFNDACSSENGYENIENKEHNLAVISSLMKRLSEREKTIVLMRYGVGYSTAYSVVEISKALDLSTERVRQLLKIGETKMREELANRLKHI